jgi:hypothetical protein
MRPRTSGSVKREIQKIFVKKDFVDLVTFPEKSIQISDRPAITVLVGDLNRTMEDEKATREFVEQMIRECGTSSRTFKSALLWVIAESAQPMREEARKLLAWQAISTYPSAANV